MKTTEFKKMIKEAVREVIQEELKEILLEAVRSPKAASVGVMQESTQPTINIPQTSEKSLSEKRHLYEQALGETMNFNTSNLGGTFQPRPGFDSANGTLPEGNVGMDQIMNLMKKK